MRYFYHPESESLFTLPDDEGDKALTDEPLLLELSREQYETKQKEAHA